MVCSVFRQPRPRLVVTHTENEAPSTELIKRLRRDAAFGHEPHTFGIRQIAEMSRVALLWVNRYYQVRSYTRRQQWPDGSVDRHNKHPLL
jgi:hypothetical protein